MPNSPIQIVLNANDFIKSFSKTGGGQFRDFYEDNDLDFIAHKAELNEQLSTLKSRQNSNSFTEISYAKLILKQSALAKSHRPFSKLFDIETAPIVGGGDLGEVFLELQPDSIDKVVSRIERAENQTRHKTLKDGRVVANPSQLRSEVGAIAEIKPYVAADKRRFSVSEAIDWLSKPQTAGSYIVELFETPPPRQEWDTLSDRKLSLFKSFNDGLASFGPGLVATRLIDTAKDSPMIGVRLEESSELPKVQLMPNVSSAKRKTTLAKISLSVDQHSALLKFLESHPLVKRISLPPIITRSHSSNLKTRIGDTFVFPAKVAGKSYPKIGIVDGGVSNILGSWVESRWGLISPDDKDEEHGTFIGGLVLSGNEINGGTVCPELDGCSIIDLDLLPKPDAFDNYYQDKPLLFFDELESAVKELKAKTNVRILNFSLNIDEHVTSDGYSYAAQALDKIAEENDVIFVISAGNTSLADLRKEWPVDAVEALRILATSRNDIIKTPAESGRNLSISALNPPDLAGIIPFAPSSYSCRGPGVRTGLKPDLAHVGGCGTKTVGRGHGLLSVDLDSSIIDDCGTSFAAPNVAKTLACLENQIEGTVSRETLLALTVHNAVLPDSLSDSKFKDVAKHLVGFGMPSVSDEILNGRDNAITLVFATRIGSGLKMSFDFNWPNSLVKNGKCYGKAKLTLVSTPPFDYKYGSEYVRVNIEAFLRQQQSDGRYLGRLDSIYLPEARSGNRQLEKGLIEHSLKWSPTKVYEGKFSGVGPSASWRLDIESLTRAGESMPYNGVPITAILTISANDDDTPVFNDMRQSLQALGTQIADIRTAARITPRV